MLRSLLMAALVAGASLAAMPEAMAQGLVPCAPEHGFCRVPYPTRVIYGVPGRTAARDVGGRGIPCSNEAFGDPAPGIPKRCSYVARGYGRGGDDWGPDRYEGPGRGFDGPRRGPFGPGPRDEMAAWQFCAREGGFCDFRGPRRVRYGAGGRFAERVSRDGIPCNNSVFGDPAPGRPKTCQVLD
ncbi:hypothetical protein [Microvirga subterranea]|uniref:Uncharacterized protein n=1 Tax=Microvirga subterranea TaxID=186651 RepID=A0A370HHX4_9HYPH|nr:hypothetical protein [Microvirga subterranea]RDI57773.1 hypothetical protein DES45_10685 [Microvirga subterranea]